MVSPVANGLQQQIPAANTYKPGGDEQTRKTEESRETTRPSGTETAEAQAAETRNNGREEESQRAAERQDERREQSNNGPRGSQLDITV